MTPARILEVLDAYQAYLERFPKPDPNHPREPAEIRQVAHLLGMIPKIRAFIAAGVGDGVSRSEAAHAIGKAFRWLGFMQGAFWVLGYYTIDEMRGHNRPT